MTFAHPEILLGFGALAIPVLVHLLGRRQARPVILPTAQFAETAQRSVRGRQWLRRIVLLGLRAGAIGLAVLALAGPRFAGKAGAGAAVESGPQARVVCLDTSPSMEAREALPSGGHTSRLSLAQAAVLGHLAAMSPDARAVLVAGGQKPICGNGRQVAGVLKAPAPMPSDEPIGSLLARALASLGRDAGTLHVVLATDATPWALRDLSPGRFRDLDADVAIVLVGSKVANGYLGLPRAVLTEGAEGKAVSLEVEAVPVDPRGAVDVRLQLDGETAVQRTRVGPGPGTARLLVPLKGSGPWQGKVWTAPDAMPLDDERFFTVAATPSARILVVDAARAETGAPRSADFVAATFAGKDPGLETKVTRADAARVDEAAVGQADVIFWVGPREGPAQAALERFLQAGGAVVWIPADPEPPAEPLVRLLGCGFGAAEDVADGATLDPGGYASALLGAFEGGSGGDLRQPVLKRRLALQPRDGSEVIRFMDGRAAIISRATGRGRAVALAFGPARAWGDLATRPEFVVLTHSLVDGVLAGGKGAEVNVVVGRGPAWRKAGNRRLPGNWTGGDPAPATGERCFSVNLPPEETGDLAPQVDRLKEAFAPGLARVADPSHGVLREGSRASPAGRDAAGWFIVPLVLLVALETLVSGRLSARASVEFPLTGHGQGV